MKVKDIAQVCHEVNRAYCQSLGDDSQPTWDNAEDWQITSAINGVRHLIGNSESTPKQSHINWLKEKVEAGWGWGETKDTQAKRHPCMMDFDELPPQQKAKDYIFHAIVKTLGG